LSEIDNKSKLEKISYSKISTFDQCPRKFFLKYEQKKRSDAMTLPLEIGTITHYGKELIGQALADGQKPNYDEIIEIVMKGYDEQVEKVVDENGEQVSTKENEVVHVLGIRELKEKYFFEWLEKDDKSGMNYDEKLENYFGNLKNLELDHEWKPVAVEPEFDFSYEGLFRLYGFIDRVDVNTAGEYRVVDYKSSKKVFDEKYIKTPLQMFIYTMAVEHMFNATPVSHIYDFMFLDKMQSACSKGFYKRGTTKLLKLYDELIECRSAGTFKPKPSPLCNWCEYCKTSKSASDEFQNECPYYSLWTPSNKTFEVNKKFEAGVVEPEMKSAEFWF